MERILSVNPAQTDTEGFVTALEAGKVIYFPIPVFFLSPTEQLLLDPVFTDPKHKNIAWHPDTGKLQGVQAVPAIQQQIQALMRHYFAMSSELITQYFPAYTGKLRSAPTTLRLHRVETRQASWRKDDSLLHVDAFPSRPNYGERILRIFTNIHPQGEARMWRIGEPFREMSRHFLPLVPRQWPGQAWLLAKLKITKRPRSRYDHIMLHLHDLMKADTIYQKNCPQEHMAFAAGSTWVCFSDQVSHAAMSGQFLLEQTFWLAVSDMVTPQTAPVRVLEQLTRQSLTA